MEYQFYDKYLMEDFIRHLLNNDYGVTLQNTSVKDEQGDPLVEVAIFQPKTPQDPAYAPNTTLVELKEYLESEFKFLHHSFKERNRMTQDEVNGELIAVGRIYRKFFGEKAFGDFLEYAHLIPAPDLSDDIK